MKTPAELHQELEDRSERERLAAADIRKLLGQATAALIKCELILTERLDK